MCICVGHVHRKAYHIVRCRTFAAKVKHLLKFHENVSVKKIPYSAKCGVHIIVFEVPEKRAWLGVEAKLLGVRVEG